MRRARWGDEMRRARWWGWDEGGEMGDVVGMWGIIFSFSAIS